MSDDIRMALTKSAIRYGLFNDRERRAVSLPKLNLPPHVEDNEATQTVAGASISSGHVGSAKVR